MRVTPGGQFERSQLIPKLVVNAWKHGIDKVCIYSDDWCARNIRAFGCAFQLEAANKQAEVEL